MADSTGIRKMADTILGQEGPVDFIRTWPLTVGVSSN
jgi:hypothetical protein